MKKQQIYACKPLPSHFKTGRIFKISRWGLKNINSSFSHVLKYFNTVCDTATFSYAPSVILLNIELVVPT